jgi:hypothetical protein
MTSDKEIIEHLLNALENALADRTALLAMIATYREHFPQIGDWEHDLEKLKTDRAQDVQKIFAPLRDAIAHSRQVEQAIQKALKDILPKGPVH